MTRATEICTHAHTEAINYDDIHIHFMVILYYCVMIFEFGYVTTWFMYSNIKYIWKLPKKKEITINVFKRV